MKRKYLFKTGGVSCKAFVCLLLAGFLIAFAWQPATAQETGVPKQYQTPVQTNSDPLPNTSLIVSPDEDYLIGASDILELKVEDAPELSGKYRLNSKGEFTMPIVGEIAAKEKTTDEISRTITDKLRGKYLKNPLVTILVAQSNSRAFFIQGAVRRPGIYQIEGKPTLLKLITIAGGLSDNYGPSAFIMREKKLGEIPIIRDDPEAAKTPLTEIESSAITTAGINSNDDSDPDSIYPKEDYKLIQANINNLLRGNLEQNINILPGDIVYIPPSDVFYVVGEVKAPGSFPLKENTSLRQAVSLAQGTNFEANLDRAIIFRTDLTTGRREEIKVNVAAIMAGKEKDVDIQPNDVLIIPNNQKKTIAKSVAKTMSGSLPMVLLRILGIW